MRLKHSLSHIDKSFLEMSGLYFTRIFVMCVMCVMPVLLLASCADESSPISEKLRVGDKVPAIAVQNLEGVMVVDPIGAAVNKLIIINVWASWCGPCRRELPSLDRLSNKIDQQHIQVMGISLDDDLHLVREYLRDVGITFTNYLDLAGAQVKKKWAPVVLPVTYIIDKNGYLLKEVVGEREWDAYTMIELLEGAVVTPELLSKEGAIRNIGMKELEKSGAVQAP